MTEQKWLRRCHASVAAIMTIFVIAAFSLIENKDVGRVVVRIYHFNSTTSLNQATFNVSVLFLIVLFTAIICHIFVAVYPASRIDRHSLLVTFPLLHVAASVGIAGISDAWALFATGVVSFNMAVVVYLITTFGMAENAVKKYIAYSVCIIFFAMVIVLTIISSDKSTTMGTVAYILSYGIIVVLPLLFFQFVTNEYKRTLLHHLHSMCCSLGLFTSTPLCWALTHSAYSHSLVVLAVMLIIISLFVFTSIWLMPSEPMKDDSFETTSKFALIDSDDEENDSADILQEGKTVDITSVVNVT